MQPENQQNLTGGAEQLPVQPNIGPENIPVLPSVEAPLINGQEAIERRADAASLAQSSGTPQYQAQPVAPQQPMAPQAPASIVTAPMVAADEDLIEKEWVDKAKEIIAKTVDDPYARNEQVNELQRSYLQKRYGKVIGTES